jgi:hypothetical protein
LAWATVAAPVAVGRQDRDYAFYVRLLTIVLVVLGALSLIAAILYFALPAHSLPSFLPGRVAHINGHRNRHGIGALVLAAIFFAVAWMAAHRSTTPAS